MFPEWWMYARLYQWQGHTVSDAFKIHNQIFVCSLSWRELLTAMSPGFEILNAASSHQQDWINPSEIDNRGSFIWKMDSTHNCEGRMKGQACRIFPFPLHGALGGGGNVGRFPTTSMHPEISLLWFPFQLNGCLHRFLLQKASWLHLAS